MLGTTHCTNAIVTRQGLTAVGVIRLGAPATLSVEPLLTWPQDLRQMVCPQAFILRGGHEYNGEPLAALDPQEVRNTLRQMKGMSSQSPSPAFSRQSILSMNYEYEISFTKS